MEIQLAEQRRRRKDQFDLRQIGRLAEDVDITLHELAETASLRSVRAPHISHLERLERSRKLVRVVRIVTGKRNRQVISQTSVHKISLFLRLVEFQLLASL